ncbi:MAG: GHKL domain-containing protein [Nitrososphaerota archaeon]|jgi:two-component system sensor histidine kinase HydH|nr:GHKL domain-containing protein [Nitrososphaerota archaeon]
MPKDDLDIKSSALKKKSSKSEKSIENTEIQIKKAKEYMKKINSQLTNRLHRIDKIKKSHERFEQQIEVLQSGKFVNRQESLMDMVNDIIEIPEAIKVNNELSGLIEKYAVEKLDLMKKLFSNEKRQTREFNEKLKENLSQLAMSEQKLKRQRDNLQIDLREKTKKLAQAERLSAIGELSARLAHDLRNPLTVLKGVVEIARARTKSGEIYFSTKQIDMMERAIARMSNQIDDVLEFVKIQSLHVTKNSLLDTLGLSLAKINKSSNIKIHIPDNSIEFVYDSDKIEIVFDNLLNNSMQAINDDGVITIRFIDIENEVEIEVEDSGGGVSDEIISKVFEPLFTTKKKGTGLGLASCKSIVEQHGGSISIRNKPTVFTIKLPKMVEISTI